MICLALAPPPVRGIRKVVIISHDERLKSVLGLKLGRNLSCDRRSGSFGFAVATRAPAAGAPAGSYLNRTCNCCRRRRQEHPAVGSYNYLSARLAKIIGHFKDDAVVVVGNARNVQPKIVNVRTQHRAQLFLRCGPNLVCGSLHVFLIKARFSGILFTWAAYRTSKLALAIAFSTKAVRRQQNPSAKPFSGTRTQRQT